MTWFSNVSMLRQRGIQSLERIIDWLPFTVGGGLFLLSSIGATWYFGVQRTDLVLIILGSVGIALSILGCVFTLIGGLWMNWQFRALPPLSTTMVVQGNHRIQSTIRLPWWIPLIQAEWSWEGRRFDVIVDGDEECVTPIRRGYCDTIHRNIHVGDAFGICEVTIRSQQPVSISILPQPTPLLMPDIVQGLRLGGEQSHPLGYPSGDRIDIRNYAVGDPVRYILWKVYARTGELVVRTPERAFEPSERLLAYLVVHSEDSIAASLASEVLRSQQLGENWAFGVDGRSEPCTDVKVALEAIVQSGDAVIQNAAGLKDFVSSQSDASSLVVFAPADDGDWVDEVLALAQRIPVQVVVAGLLPTRVSMIQEVLFEPQEFRQSGEFHVDTIEAVTLRLEQGGVQVRIVTPSVNAVMTPRDLRQHWERVAS